MDPTLVRCVSGIIQIRAKVKAESTAWLVLPPLGHPIEAELDEADKGLRHSPVPNHIGEVRSGLALITDLLSGSQNYTAASAQTSSFIRAPTPRKSSGAWMRGASEVMSMIPRQHSATPLKFGESAVVISCLMP